MLLYSQLPKSLQSLIILHIWRSRTAGAFLYFLRGANIFNMNTLLTAVIIGAGLFFTYRWNIFAGLALSVFLLVYGVYHFMPQIYRSRGAKCFGEADYAGAKKWYGKAVETGRAKVDIKIEYSYVLLRTGDVDAAEQIVDNMLCYKLKPQYKGRAVIQRCMCYYKKGNIDEAIADAEELYNDGFKNTMLYGMLGFFKLVKAPKAQETFDFCTEAISFAPDDRDIMDNMLICYYNRGEYDKAKEISDKVLEKQPKFVEAWYHGAQIDNKLKRYDDALEKLERINECNRSFMTTVSESEVENLRAEVTAKRKARI